MDEAGSLCRFWQSWPELRKASAAVGVVVALVCCGTAFAHTSSRVEMTCPYDGTKFTFEAQASGSSFGTTLDFMQVGALQSPWPLAVCPTNGFVFFKAKFDDEELERLRPMVLSPAYQALKEETAYYRAAWIRERTGADHREVSILLLSATWEVFRDPRRYQQYATELIARLPRDIEAAVGDEKLALRRLLGELMRRVGRSDEARQYFLDFAKEQAPESNDGLIAAFEVRLIDKKDTQPHLVAEAIKPGEEDANLWRKRRELSLSDTQLLTQSHVFKLDGSSRLVFWVGNDALYGITSSHPTQFDLATTTAKAIGTTIPWGSVFAFSQDGGTLVSDGPNSPVLLQIDAHSFAVRHSVAMPASVRTRTQQIVNAHDGKSALIELDNRLMAFAIDSDALLPLSSPTFSEGRSQWWLKAADPTGPRVAVQHADAIEVWDYKKSVVTRRLRPPGWIKDMTADLDVIYSVDGKRIFIGADAYWDRECELTAWDSQTGAQLAKMRVKGAPGAQLAVSPDEKLVAMICGSSLYLWKSTLSEPPIETAHTKNASSLRQVVFSPDSRKLAVRLDDALLVFAIAR
jgi:hypothetical protein